MLPRFYPQIQTTATQGHKEESKLHASQTQYSSWGSSFICTCATAWVGFTHCSCLCKGDSALSWMELKCFSRSWNSCSLIPCMKTLVYLSEVGVTSLHFCTEQPQFCLWDVKLESTPKKSEYANLLAKFYMELLHHSSLYWLCLKNNLLIHWSL